MPTPEETNRMVEDAMKQLAPKFDKTPEEKLFDKLTEATERIQLRHRNTIERYMTLRDPEGLVNYLGTLYNEELQQFSNDECRHLLAGLLSFTAAKSLI